MYDAVGAYQVGVDFEFLESTLTDRGIMEQSLGINQFLKIKDVTYVPDRKVVIFDCDVFEHLLN
jgi:hypothetical protein